MNVIAHFTWRLAWRLYWRRLDTCWVALLMSPVMSLPALFLTAVLLTGPSDTAHAQQADRSDASGATATGSSTDRPLTLPGPIAHPVSLRRGIQFGGGTHNITVTSEPLGTELEKDSSFSDGASLHLDWLLDQFRVSYVRQAYRAESDGVVTYQGQLLSRVDYDSDQFWIYHGGRPWNSLYLAYGLGVQRREILLTTSSGGEFEFNETLAMAGLMLDYAIAAPVSLQIRMVWEDDGGFFQASGQTVFISYTIPL